MFNLNIPAASLLNVDNGGGICTTPKTPEIVNTLIAMTTNPLDNYSFMTTSATTANDQSTNTSISPSSSSTSTTNTNTTGINNNINNSNNQQLISQDSSHSSCSGSSFDSPTGTNSTPSVQQTCSQFIKAGLKITIQNKRKMSSCDSSSGTEQGTTKKSKYARKSINGDTSEEDVTDNRKSSRTGLTPEDEDRRRRRRERNKIAATKCRMKKRERTQNLINESEQLETQNVDMKTQIRNLEMERRQLSDMLESHASSCIRPGGYQPSPNLCQSPAYKYLQELGFCDSPQQQLQQQQSQQHDMQQQQMQQKDQPQLSPSQRQPIPSVNTIKFPRNNGLIQQQPSINTNVDILPNGYCKASPTNHELGYLNSPSNQDLTVCMTNASPTHHHHHHHHHHQHHHNLHQNGNCASPHTAALLKSDYIPNCENTDGSTNCGALSVVDTCNTTADFVLKNELVDTQSPYTTAQSAERFLFETNCENFDIKHITNNLNNNNTNNNNNNNNNTNSHNNINAIVDFHTQLIATPVSCQPSSYDSLLIKNDFLTTTDTDLLAQLTDTADAEFTDLDSGVTAYSHMTNGGCLA